MSGAVVIEVDRDEALPALAKALDTERMLPPLMKAAGLPDAGRMACSAEVLNHKPGRRCTIRYTLHPGSDERPVALIAKLYGVKATAGRIYRWTRALRDGSFSSHEPLCVPAPLALVPSLGLIVHESVAGADLRHALATSDSYGALSLAARWLARLHGAPPPRGVTLKGLAHELRKAGRWCDEVVPFLQANERRRLRLASDALHGLAQDLTECAPALIHRDFYPANVFWDGHRVWGLDFDQLALGDPALDVGHFLAHLQNLSLRATGRAEAYADAGAVFLSSYLEAGRADIAPRLPFFKAYTYLKLAAKEARRKRGEWQRLLAMLTELACREAEGAPPEGALRSENRAE